MEDQAPRKGEAGCEWEGTDAGGDVRLNIRKSGIWEGKEVV